MSYVNTIKRNLTVWIFVANLMALSALTMSLWVGQAFAHEDQIHHHITTQTATHIVDGHMMLDLSLTNNSGQTIEVESVGIDGVALRSIDQSLADQASMEVSGKRAIQIPQEYRSSMFLAIELDLGRDGTMTIPVVVSK